MSLAAIEGSNVITRVGQRTAESLCPCLENTEIYRERLMTTY